MPGRAAVAWTITRRPSCSYGSYSGIYMAPRDYSGKDLSVRRRRPLITSGSSLRAVSRITRRRSRVHAVDCGPHFHLVDFKAQRLADPAFGLAPDELCPRPQRSCRAPVLFARRLARPGCRHQRLLVRREQLLDIAVSIGASPADA